MTTPPPPMPSPARPGWWTRNWKWCVPVGIVSILGLFAAFIFMIVSLVFGMLKSSEPYKDAVAKATSNPQVQSELGTPVTEGFIPSGNINLNNDAGNASLDIPISGPKGNGGIRVVAIKTAGVWTYTTMEVVIDGKPEKIDLKP